MQYLKNNGFPKVGKLMVNKSGVQVYTYGAHKVLRVFFGNEENCKKDYDLANHLINNPSPGIVRIYKTALFKYKGNTCLAVVMRKCKTGNLPSWKDWYCRLQSTVPDKIYTKNYNHEPGWDMHSGNVGRCPRSKNIVVFDVWSGIGGSGSKSYNPKKARSTKHKLFSKKIKKARIEFRKFCTEHGLGLDPYDVENYMYDKRIIDQYRGMIDIIWRYGV